MAKTLRFQKADIDGLRCFGSGCLRMPELRLVQLFDDGNHPAGEVFEGRVGIALLCKQCASRELTAHAETLCGSLESDLPAHGLMLLPWRLADGEVEQLRGQVTRGPWAEEDAPTYDLGVAG